VKRVAAVAESLADPCDFEREEKKFEIPLDKWEAAFKHPR
jgi:hypothetical protein